MIVAGIFDWVGDLFNWINDDLLHWIEDFSSSPWFYAVLFAVALLDSIIPTVPSETTVIVGGIAAGAGDASIVLVILLAAFGAYIGDSIAYFLGNRFGPGLVQRFMRKGNAEEAIAKAGRQIADRGGLLLITARFIPGGRTIMTFSCGATHQPFLAWFTRWDLFATFIWASYAGLLGYFFGDRFSHSTAFWLAFGTALSVTVIIEAIRFVRHRGQRGKGDLAVDSGADVAGAAADTFSS